jgi:hypothetical protein
MKGRAQHERKYTKSCQAFEHCDRSVADGLSDSSETSFVAATGQLWVLGAQSAVSTGCPLCVKSTTDVRFTPECGHRNSTARCLLCAKSRHGRNQPGNIRRNPPRPILVSSLAADRRSGASAMRLFQRDIRGPEGARPLDILNMRRQGFWRAKLPGALRWRPRRSEQE